MLLAHLKKIRIAVSLLFLVSTSLVLLDFRNLIPAGWIRAILFLQFTPSIFNFFTLAGFASAGFFVALALTFLFGRIYCSTICPLGTFQDIVSFASRKIRPKRYHEPLERFAAIHVAFLLVTVGGVVLGTVFAVSLLDPFSNFGRIIGSLVRPAVLLANNGLSSLFEAFGNYDLYPVELKVVSTVSILLPMLLLFLVGWMSFQHGRLYCNSVCPVGSFLRLLSKYALFRIVIDESQCNGCQLCQRVCKAGCIDRKKKVVDFERCVDCFNCFSACPAAALRISRYQSVRRSEDPQVDAQRRTFLVGTSLLFLGQKMPVDTVKAPIPQKDSTVPEWKHHPVSPPGSKSISHFTQTCTACHVCISSCPSQVLQPSTLQYGLGGLLQPTMDFNASYCNFECTVCTDVCPSGALRPLNIEEKKTSQAGRVVFIRENCVVYTENTDCGACTEHCPTKAVVTVPYKKSRIPEVKPDYCIGCGACEHACPTRPYRAIYVDGNSVHLVAKKKEPEKKQEVILKEDFPF